MSKKVEFWICDTCGMKCDTKSEADTCSVKDVERTRRQRLLDRLYDCLDKCNNEGLACIVETAETVTED